MLEVVERDDDVPAIHLALVERLRAVVQAGRIAEADGVGRREQPEGRMRFDDAALVEEREPALDFEDALDDEHHVRPPGVVFVEDERARPLQRPRQHAGLELGDLLVVPDDDGVLADEIHAADVAVEVHAHAGPVQPRRHLLDVARLPGAVTALDHHAAVVHEAGQQRERRVAIEHVVRIERRHVLVGTREGRHPQVGVYLEQLAGGKRHVGEMKGSGRAGSSVVHGGCPRLYRGANRPPATVSVCLAP